MTQDEQWQWPPRRSLAASRVDYASGMVELAAPLKTREDLPLPQVGTQTFPVSPGTLEERKAEADRIAEAIGAVPDWCDGYYVATGTIGAMRLEVYFTPPIRASGADSDDGAGGDA
jgi:hypothetical protein